MRLHIAEETGEVLDCPDCERELWPAYWTEEGLEVGYWGGFAPPDGLAGLLVCGNPECTYEEEITFTDHPDDAVVWNSERTYFQFEDELSPRWPQTWLREYKSEIERLLEQTDRPKLRSLVDWLEQGIEDRQERIDRWLAEVDRVGYPVTLQAEGEELAGQILASHADELVLQTPDGEVRVLPKEVVWEERIEYPRQPRGKPQPEGEPERVHWFWLKNSQYMVVEGHHLVYGEPTELGGHYKGRCRDPVAAAALRLREVVPNYWEGLFRADEIERYYLRREYVKIRGYWVREGGHNDEYRLIQVDTKDPDVAQALDLHPLYSTEVGEFGCWDGELFKYYGSFSIDEIAETRWEEEVQPLPPDHW